MGLLGRVGDRPHVIGEHGALLGTHDEEHDEGLGPEVRRVRRGDEDAVALAQIREAGVVDDEVSPQHRSRRAAMGEEVCGLRQ